MYRTVSVSTHMYSPATWVLTLLYTWSEKSTLQHVLHFLHGHFKAHFLIKTAIRLTKLAFLSSLRGPTDGWSCSEVSPWQKKSSRGLRAPPAPGARDETHLWTRAPVTGCRRPGPGLDIFPRVRFPVLITPDACELRVTLVACSANRRGHYMILHLVETWRKFGRPVWLG